MKTITIPEDVALLNLDGTSALDENKYQVVVSFKQFVNTVLLTDVKFGRDMKSILSAVEIKNRLEKATDVLELDNADYELLNSIASEPSASYIPVSIMQLSHFLIAIRDAK